MAYIGGKSKCYQHIIKILNDDYFNGFEYIEPFVGYAHILRRIQNKKSYIASDNNLLLYTLLKYIQKSNDYPTITKEDYDFLKNDNTNENLINKSFAAFTYSYNGKEFGGYTNKLHNRNYPQERKTYYDNLRKNNTFMKTKIYHKSYDKINPNGKLIYCDPPYANTTKYGKNDFDTNKFWDIIRKWSKNNYVFISEYEAPSDFIVISKKNKYSSLSGKGSNSLRIEKLFAHKSIKNTDFFKSFINKEEYDIQDNTTYVKTC